MWLHNRSLIGDSFHPYYLAVLSRAVNLGYTLPSGACMTLQNKLVVDLVNANIWEHNLDYLFVHADDSPDNHMSRINWKNPTKTPAPGGGVKIIKKGITGPSTWVSNYVPGDDGSAGGGLMSNAHSFFGFYCTTGGTQTVINNPTVSGSVGGNYQTIRYRISPLRIDFLFNNPTAGPATIRTGTPVNNRLWLADRGVINGDSNRTVVYEGSTLRFDSGGSGASGNLPLGQVSMQAMESPMSVGLHVGGKSVAESNRHLTLNTIIESYMAAVQAL